MTYKAINWNKIEDSIDKATWEKLTEQFWLDTRIAISNDLDDWRKLTADERLLVSRVFGGLTLLDTLQSENGVKHLIPDVRTQHEEAVLNNISFMEDIHAKSYSSIFSTLLTPKEIDDIFDWIHTNEKLQNKATIINNIYQTGTPLQKKIASVFLESFLFYSGFYTPLWYLGNNKLPNVAEIIKLIIRDECMTAEHELLTPTGWKSVKDITVSDKVLQYNANGTTNFVHPKKVSSHFESEIHRFTNQQNHVSLATSPKHRIITQSIETGELTEVHAKDYKQKDDLWLHTGELEQKGIDSITPTESLMIAENIHGNKPLTLPNLETITSEYCKDYINELYVMSKQKENSTITYESTNKIDIEIVQTIATLAGYQTQIEHNNVHCLQIHKNKQTTNSQEVNHTISNDGQMVYGIEVDSSYLVTKHNNAVTVTGNSVHGTLTK